MSPSPSTSAAATPFALVQPYCAGEGKGKVGKGKGAGESPAPLPTNGGGEGGGEGGGGEGGEGPMPKLVPTPRLNSTVLLRSCMPRETRLLDGDGLLTQPTALPQLAGAPVAACSMRLGSLKSGSVTPPTRAELLRSGGPKAGALPAEPRDAVAHRIATGVVVDQLGQQAQHGVLELLACC